MGRGGHGKLRKQVRGTAHYCDNAGHTQGRFGSGTNNRWRGVSVFKRPTNKSSRASLGGSVSTTQGSMASYMTDFSIYLSCARPCGLV